VESRPLIGQGVVDGSRDRSLMNPLGLVTQQKARGGLFHVNNRHPVGAD